MVSQFLLNASVLVALLPIYSLFNPRIRKGDFLSKALAGLLFGLIAIVAMLIPYQYSVGIVYDGRTIVMVMAGLFGGGTVGIIAAGIASIYRLILGGNGVIAGCVMIVSTMLVGLGFRRLSKNHPGKLSILEIFGIGIVAYIVMMASSLLIIPWPSGVQAIRDIWLVILLIFPFATLLMGILLRREDHYLEVIKEIQDNEARYQAILMSAQDGYWCVDLEGNILEANTAYCEMTGYTKQELQSLNVADVDVLEGREEVLKHLQEIVKQKTTRFETLHARKNGEVFPAEITSTHVHGPVDFLFTFIRDLTEIKAMDREIQEKNALLAESQQIAHLGSWDFDVLAEKLTWSKEVYNIYGITPDEFDGTMERALELVHPEDRASVEAAFLNTIEGGKDSFEIEHRLIRKEDGEVRVVHEKCRHVKNDEGDVVRSIGMIQDITEQFKTLEKLQVLKTRYEAILQSIPDIVAEVNNEKIYTWVNHAGEIFFGENVVGNSADEYFVGTQDTFQRVQPLFDGKDDTIYVESWQKRRDGQKRLLAWWCSTLKDANGEVIGLLSTARDITEAMRDKTKIINLNKELEQRVQSRTAELESANEDLRIFSYSISHDLRGPLRAINGFSEILKRRHKASLNDEGQEYLGYVIDAAKQLDKLIDDLLGYARLGVSAVQNTDIDFEQLFNQVLQMLSATIDEKKAEIILPEEFPMIKSDPVLLEHIIYNFMDNALKFQPADQQARISISCETNSGEFKLIVSDNGIGIPPQYISKLFTPFQRLHSQDEYHGTGMGLAFVKKCTELMGGKAGVTSNRGEGSSFWVSFPISRKES